MKTFRETIKRIAAIGSGALIACTCFGVAGLATNLSDYPAPFIQNGQWVGLIAVGAAAQAGDIIGATDIAATLAQNIGIVPGTTTLSGGKQQDVPLGKPLSDKFGVTLSPSDLAGFQDTSVDIDIGGVSNSYNVKDQLTLGNGLVITTGLIENSTSKDWGKDIWMKVSGTGQIQYNFVFKTSLKSNNYIVHATSDDPIAIEFLGKKLNIIGASASSITAQIANEYYLTYGQTATVNGKVIKLVNVGTSKSVVIDVDGTQKVIDGSGTVNGLRVKVTSTFPSDTPADRAATLLIGSDVSKSYSDGDAYIGEDTDNPEWVWNLANLDLANPTIGIKNAKTRVSPTSDNAPIRVGSSDSVLASPEGFFKITLGNPTTDNYKDYSFNGLAIQDLYAGAGNNIIDKASQPGLEIKASGGGKNGFLIDGKYTDRLFIWGDGATPATLTVYWANPNEGNHYQNTSHIIAANETETIATIQTPDTSSGLPLAISMNPAGTEFAIGTGNLQGIAQVVKLEGGKIKYLGQQSGAAIANDLLVDTTDVSTMDSSARTQDGIVIDSIKSNGDNDFLKLEIPSKVGADFAVRTTISSSGTTTTTSAGSGGLHGISVAKLDTEVADPKAQNLILVGGTAVNKLTAQALGVTYPTYGTDAGKVLGIGANQATLKLVENAFGGTNTALIVAGWEATDTRAACSVLKDFSTYKDKLVNKQVIVANGQVSQPVAINATNSTA